jgi:hypothetical protein
VCWNFVKGAAREIADAKLKTSDFESETSNSKSETTASRAARLAEDFLVPAARAPAVARRALFEREVGGSGKTPDGLALLLAELVPRAQDALAAARATPVALPARRVIVTAHATFLLKEVR